MRIAVVYESHSGNTKSVAEAIAGAFRSVGEVDLMEAGSATLQEGTGVLIVGGPTEAHGMTAGIKACLERLKGLSGLQVAAFDTRLKWPLWLSGSAARQIGDVLTEAGGELMAPPESFIVTMEPKLHPGEIERAGAWASTLTAAVKVPQAA